MKSFKSFGIAAALLLAVLAGAQTNEDRKVMDQIGEAVKVYRAGDIPGAKQMFIELQRKNPNQPDVLSWLGFLYLRTDEPQKAVEMLEKVAPMRPADLEVRNNLGAAYMQTNQPDKAFEVYKALAVVDPKRFEPWYNMGNIQLARKAYGEAVSDFSKANEIRPDDPFVLNNLGVAYEALGNFAAAGDMFGRASNLRMDNATFAKNAGYVFVRAGSNEKAQPFLERAYKMDKSDSHLGMVLAGNYAKTGKTQDAMRVYRDLEGSQSGNAGYWYNVGYLLSKTDTQRAEAAYRKSLALNGSDIDVLRNLGIMVYQRGDYKEAAMLFEKWAGLDPSSLDAKMNLAAASAKSGNVPRAIGLWEDILKAEPRRTAMRVSLANALWQNDERERARAHYQIVLQEDRSNADAHNGMGLYHLSQSNLMEAESEFRAAIDSRKNFPPAYNNLAVTLEKLKRRKEAIAVLEKGLQVAPGTYEMKENLRRMKDAERKKKKK